MEDSGARAPVMGKVTAAAPLRVLVEGNTMEREDLLCNADLLRGAGPHWTAGERLLLQPIEEAQRYIILCKVVEV